MYAQYFANYLSAYAAEGLPLWALTLQNEPLYSPTTYAAWGSE